MLLENNTPEAYLQKSLPCEEIFFIQILSTYVFNIHSSHRTKAFYFDSCASMFDLLLILLKYLKVLSSEMDPVEIRLIRLVFIKERGPEGFQKNLPALHPPRALQSIRSPPCFLIANYTTIQIASENIHSALG